MRLKGPALLALVACLIAAAPAAATVLIFDQASPGVPTGTGGPVDQTYGDNVSSTPQGGFDYGTAGGFTPNVTVSYTGAVMLWTTAYGDLVNIIWSNSITGIFEVTMTASGGLLTSVLGFDLAGWPTTDYTISSVQVLAAANPFSQSNVLVKGTGSPAHTSFSFPTPPTGPTVTVRIDASNLGGAAGTSDNIGLDNLQFSETLVTGAVPEPASVLLLGTGLVGLAARIRRHRR